MASVAFSKNELTDDDVLELSSRLAALERGAARLCETALTSAPGDERFLKERLEFATLAISALGITSVS